MLEMDKSCALFVIAVNCAKLAERVYLIICQSRIIIYLAI